MWRRDSRRTPRRPRSSSAKWSVPSCAPPASPRWKSAPASPSRTSRTFPASTRSTGRSTIHPAERWTVLTDVGRQRTSNEDAAGVLPPSAGLDSGAIVCDGVGGGAAGEVASRIAVERVTASLASGRGDISERLGAAIADANAAVRAYAHKHLDRASCGSTVVVAVVHGSHLTVAHVGDSRAYLLRGGTLMPLTLDHSFVAELVRAGKIAQGDA